MDLQHLFQSVRRWLAVIIVGAVVAAAAAYFVSGLVPPTYESRALLIVGQGLDSSRLDYTQILAAQLEAQTYASLIDGRSALEATIEELGLETTPEELARRTQAIATTDSRFIEIVASSTDAETAAAIANALADHIIGLTTAVPDETQAVIVREIEATEAEVAAAVAELAELSAQAPSAARDTRRSAVSDRIVTLRSIRADLLAQVAVGSETAVAVVSEATPAIEPSSPRPFLNAALAGLVGIVATVGVVLLLDRPAPHEEEATAQKLGARAPQAVRDRG